MIWKKKPNQLQEQQGDAMIKKKPLPPSSSSSSSSFSSSTSSSSSSNSIFSLSTLLPLSWLSKLKKRNKKNSPPFPPTTERSTGPHPKPLYSPPTPLHSKSERIQFSSSSSSAAVVEAPRRLSVGDDNSHRVPILVRSARHHSVGGELDLGLHFRSDLHLIRPNPPPEADRPDSPVLPRRRRRRRRAERGILEGIELNQNPIDLKPIATGDRMDEMERSMKGGRRSFSGKVRPRVRVCSPRLVRKRAVEEERRRSSSCSNSLESFAVMKNSRDPSRDFRDSMVEMIWDKGIQRPEELESLLACYLELNSDEHHDVIVKVFMQVWFDLNRQANRPV